jgi:hypothetical protein
LNESSSAGLVRMFQEGAKFERMIKSNLHKAAVVEDKKRAALIARNKLTTAWNVKVNKINNDFRARQAAKTN